MLPGNPANNGSGAQSACKEGRVPGWNHSPILALLAILLILVWDNALVEIVIVHLKDVRLIQIGTSSRDQMVLHNGGVQWFLAHRLSN